MIRILAVTAAVGLAVPALAQDVALGREIAEEFCVGCHDIEDGGAMKTYPPSFDSISIFRDQEQIRARVMFPDLHTRMAQWGTFLGSDQVSDVVAYIMSLE